ncbi:MAG: tRNA 2-thiouridine(34) synthase MnmA [Oscillospiraceae bacterium]|jgi:tRNA-specific 2-thiouridylase|nr:tRNA 2-thiouridine(34) synthase MnmA [Oscillospiraceae bacterium]
MSVLVAMSGGVDSSVAAALLMEQGLRCAGATLRLTHNDPAFDDTVRERTCCSLSDVEDARSVCARLGIAFYVLNFTEQFNQTVVRRFAEGYLRGETPNPCIDCNRFVKFHAIAARADLMGHAQIASGHYAQSGLDPVGGRYYLKKGVDLSKDQSYVLYCLPQDILKRTLFPLGALTKAQVREIAQSRGFLNAGKHDSQDICFVPDGDYAGFLERYTGIALREGDFLNPDGVCIGKHRGFARYTIGQRKGLGLSLKSPGYVCGIDAKKNTVTVGGETQLLSRDLTARELNFVGVAAIKSPLRCKAKIRYRHSEQSCVAEQIDTDVLRVRFDEPQRAITAGQDVVLYDDDYVLGGGIIT